MLGTNSAPSPPQRTICDIWPYPVTAVHEQQLANSAMWLLRDWHEDSIHSPSLLSNSFPLHAQTPLATPEEWVRRDTDEFISVASVNRFSLDLLRFGAPADLVAAAQKVGRSFVDATYFTDYADAGIASPMHAGTDSHYAVWERA